MNGSVMVCSLFPALRGEQGSGVFTLAEPTLPLANALQRIIARLDHFIHLLPRKGGREGKHHTRE